MYDNINIVKYSEYQLLFEKSKKRLIAPLDQTHNELFLIENLNINQNTILSACLDCFLAESLPVQMYPLLSRLAAKPLSAASQSREWARFNDSQSDSTALKSALKSGPSSDANRRAFQQVQAPRG